MPNSAIVNISVLLQGAAVSRQGFSTILVAGRNAPIAAIPVGTTKEYSLDDFAEEMADDGWAGSEAEYLAISDMAAQDIHPETVKVGHLADFAAKVIQIDVVAGPHTGNFTVTVSREGYADLGYTFAASGSTATQVKDGLVSGLNALAAPALAQTAASLDTDSFTLTADNAGEDFTVTLASPSDDMTQSTTTANSGYGSSLATIALSDDDWFGLYGVDMEDHHILARAKYAEANRKLHIAQSTDTDILVAATTDDIASLLQDQSYDWTGIYYHNSSSEHLSAALMAAKLGVDPDEQATVWYAATLSGIAVQGLSTAQQSAAEGKNAGHYNLLKGVGFTSQGKQSSGKFTDLMVTAGWLEARISESHVARLLEYSNAGKKIPYTDRGIGLLESDVRGIWGRGVAAEHLSWGTPDDDDDPEPVFNFPSRADSDPADRTARIYRYTVTGGIAGAIFQIEGTTYLTT